MEEFIELKNVNFKYNNNSQEKNVILNLNLKIKKGEFISIIGHNGSGKSTLAKLLSAMILPKSGDILISGMSVKKEENKYKIRKKIGLVLQNPDNQLVASVVEEDVAFAPENLGINPEEIRKRVNWALKSVGMYEHRLKSVHKLSGGQKQRVAIAGIIAMCPDCIILDESTAMLDPEGREEVLNTVKFLNKEFNITVILITHFMEECVNFDRVLVMNQGQLVLDGTPREVFSRADLLKKYKLSLPQASEIIYNLKKLNLNLKDVLNENECVIELAKLFKERKNVCSRS